MLVLSRKPLESIIISNDIVVTVLSILGSKVKLGIQAPRSVLIHRTELMEAIPDENVECDPQLHVVPLAPSAAPLKTEIGLLAGTIPSPPLSLKE